MCLEGGVLMFSWYDEIQKIKNWIDENIEEEISLEQLSDLSNYSPFYLSKKFHEFEGVSLREYILISKVQHSANQLITTSDRIIDIATRYGYSSQEAFTRAFLKVYRITPWVYRKLQKPSPNIGKGKLLNSVGFTEPIGGKDMKIYVKQMYDWNYYAYYAEDVDEKYWEYFKADLWWQIGNSFIKSFDNVKDFEYCADNFTKYGETVIKQQLKIISTPWERALELFVSEMNKLEVTWFVHGSAAMALWGIDVEPKDINVIIPNYSDFDVVRDHFYRFAIRPIEQCEDWLMSGLGYIFMEVVIGIAFYNRELEPYDRSKLDKVLHNGKEIYVESLEKLKTDNENYGRTERVKMIEKKIKSNI